MTADILLISQDRSVHSTPCTASDYDTVLAGLVTHALAHQGADGNLELDPAGEDVGDTSLGVTSLLLLAWRRLPLDSQTQESLGSAIRRSLDFFLTRRVFREDNPGYPFCLIRDSHVPHARYVVAPGSHPFGDWPSTVWALLQAVNVLRLGSGVATAAHLEELLDVARGYWTWLTEVTPFNSQGTDNQALGAVVGGLMLADALRAGGRENEAQALAGDAMSRFATIYEGWTLVQGVRIPREHGGGWDGNYGPIAMSFLAQAHRLTGDSRFAEAGCALARYLDDRLTAGGFDLGGPRYSGQHAGFEAVLGLRYFGRLARRDVGRYLGDQRCPYLMDADQHGDGTSAPDGHFAFMTVWAIQDDPTWWEETPRRNERFQLRHHRVSVGFDEAMNPRLIEVDRGVVIPSVIDRQHGICPFYRHGQVQHLLTRPLGPVRSVELDRGQVSAKLVAKAVATRAEVLITTQTLYLSDGESLRLVVLLDSALLPQGSSLAMLAGLPYATPARVPNRLAKITHLTTDGGHRFDFATPAATLTTTHPVRAGALTITGNAPLRLSNPDLGPGFERFVFSSPMTVHQTQEQAAFALAADPRGYGDPDQAWSQLLATNLVELVGGQIVSETASPDGPLDEAIAGPPGGPLHGSSSRWIALEVCYSPTSSPPPTPALVERSAMGITLTWPDVTAVVGPPVGDAFGRPILTLR